MRITVPLLLTGYAVAVAVIGTRWLPRASWAQRMPRAGIAAWHVLTVTFIAAALAASLLIAIPCFSVSLDWITAAELREHYSSAAGIAASTTAAVVTLAISGRLAWVTASAMLLAKRRRARHDYALALVGRPGPVPGTVVLDDGRPAVYCLPGRRRIVFTSGALQRLDSQQFQAVLAHERAHLAGRHHLINMLARIPPGAFPGIRLLDIAAGHIGSLVEMAADDTAARHAHRLSLARALLALGMPTVQAPALGAAGTATAQRIRRLVEARRPVSSSRRAAGFALTLLAAPAAALAVPTLALLAAPHCEHAVDHLQAGRTTSAPQSERSMRRPVLRPGSADSQSADTAVTCADKATGRRMDAAGDVRTAASAIRTACQPPRTARSLARPRSSAITCRPTGRQGHA